jgi:hypothetical protein
MSRLVFYIHCHDSAIWHFHDSSSSVFLMIILKYDVFTFSLRRRFAITWTCASSINRHETLLPTRRESLSFDKIMGG